MNADDGEVCDSNAVSFLCLVVRNDDIYESRLRSEQI